MKVQAIVQNFSLRAVGVQLVETTSQANSESFACYLSLYNSSLVLVGLKGLTDLGGGK